MSEERVLLAHGDGGQLMAELIERVFVARLGTGEPAGDDSARIAVEPASAASYRSNEKGEQQRARPIRPRRICDTTAGAHRRARLTGALVFTTDAFVVDPMFFPGGDIGKLAVCGTVNDLAAAGARPVALSASFILEEGLVIAELERVVDSMAASAAEAGVQVICGDTKVVPRGRADKVYVTTSGVGAVMEGVSVSGAAARPGDMVLVSGPVGDHGLAVLSVREGLEFDSPIESDCAPLAGMTQALLEAAPGVHVLRDATRGGLAAVLNEIARQSNVEIEVSEAAVPVRRSVAAACELLGIDPLFAANEGKMVVLVEEAYAEAALGALRAHPLGGQAARIGRVTAGEAGRVLVETELATHRILDRHVGEQMPRIC